MREAVAHDPRSSTLPPPPLRSNPDGPTLGGGARRVKDGVRVRGLRWTRPPWTPGAWGSSLTPPCLTPTRKGSRPARRTPDVCARGPPDGTGRPPRRHTPTNDCHYPDRSLPTRPRPVRNSRLPGPWSYGLAPGTRALAREVGPSLQVTDLPAQESVDVGTGVFGGRTPNVGPS